MSPEENKTLENHEYDGITEYNNPAPFWWQALFYISIVFGVCYIVYYQFGNGTSLAREYENEKTEWTVQGMKNKSQGPSAAELKAIYADAGRVHEGKEVFASKCVACHAADGGGSVGPNLTDDAWIHGDGTLAAIYQTVSQGVPEKGMPPWGPVLKADELQNVVAYVRSLRGTHPAQPKAPQGEVHAAVPGE